MLIRGISFRYDRDAEPLLRSRSYRGYLDVLRREGFAVQRMQGNYVTGTWQGETVQLQIWNGEGYLDGSPIGRAWIKGKINYDRGWDINQDPTWKRRIIALAKKLAAAPRYPDDQDDVGEAAGAVERAEAMLEEARDLLNGGEHAGR